MREARLSDTGMAAARRVLAEPTLIHIFFLYYVYAVHHCTQKTCGMCVCVVYLTSVAYNLEIGKAPKV